MPTNIKLPSGEWRIDFRETGAVHNVRIQQGLPPQEVPIGNGPPALVTNTETGQTFEMGVGQELRDGRVETFEPQELPPPGSQPAVPANPPEIHLGGSDGPSGHEGNPVGPGIGLPPGLGGPLGPPLGGLQAGGPQVGGGPGLRGIDVHIQFAQV